MTAATYGSGDASPDHVNYADANLVAAHCYSVLGWAYENGQKYIVLRNPWGSTEATKNILGGTAWFYDMSWRRPIALANRTASSRCGPTRSRATTAGSAR
jgi:hypothetical protein